MQEKIQTLDDLRTLQAGYRQARVIQSAAHLRLFDHTGEWTTLAELTAATGLHARGLDALLDALAALGLLEKEDERYRNAPVAAEHLVSDAASHTVWALSHSERLYRRWGLLPDAVRQGGLDEEQKAAFKQERGDSRVFTLAMHTHSLRKAGTILDRVDLAGVRRVMDVGGGPGTWLIAAGERIPGLEGVLVDQAGPLEVARELLAGAGLEGAVHRKEEDILAGEGPLAEGIDLAILSNVLHIYGPENNVRILRRIRASLAPGGRLLVHEFFLDECGTAPLNTALFAVNMLLGTDEGRSWKRSQTREWLAAAGFGAEQELDLSMDSQTWVVAPA